MVPPMCMWSWLIGMLSLRLLGAGTMAAEAAASVPSPSIVPSFIRVELAGGASAQLIFQVTSPGDGVVLAVESDCRCLHVTTPLPVPMTLGRPARLEAQVAGVTTGIESLTLHTSIGSVTAQVQVVTAGLGQGRDVLGATLAKVAQQKQELWLLAHDVRGVVRNCGCSSGSLGGAHLLAGLSCFCRKTQPTVQVRCILTGDTDGDRPGVADALMRYGWEVAPSAIVVTQDPSPHLTVPGIVAVVCADPSPVNHRRMVRPIVSGGLVVQGLLIDAGNQIAEQVAIPIDATLPAESAILVAFPDRLTFTLRPDAMPSNACQPCHEVAHGQWAGSRHAQAWMSLKEHDRTDGCILCHTSPFPAARERATGVGCTACHLGGEGHVTAAGKVKTTGTVDCRSCHNAQHHPAFVAETAWKSIAHGDGASVSGPPGRKAVP